MAGIGTPGGGDTPPSSTRQRWFAIIILVCGLSILLGCGEPDPAPDRIRMALASAPVNLDPRIATDAASARVNRLLYRRLVRFDAADRPLPDLADWEHLSPTHYRFSLRESARGRQFSHGGRLEAGDVHATLTSILDEATGSPFRSQLSVIRDMQVLDAQRIDFHLRRPDPLFPALLALEVLPADLIAADHPFHHEPVGSGPFLLEDWPEAGRLTSRRRAGGQLIELVRVKDPGVRVMKLLRGEIDLLQGDLSPELFGLLRDREDIRMQQRPGSNFTYIGLNLEDPELARPEVRRALALAIDRRAIIEYVMGGAARTAHGLLPPHHWAGADGLAEFSRDLQQSRALLKAAGYGPERPLELEYKTSTDPFRVRLATIIQAQLAEAGIRVRVRSLDWGTFFGDIKAGSFQMYSLTWVGIKTPDHFRYVFHSASVPPRGANRGRYRSPEADALIEQAERAPDLEQQGRLYGRLQALLLAELPYIPLWYEDQILAGRPGVTGYRLAADGNYDGLTELKRR